MRRSYLIPLAILAVIAIASVAQAGRYGGWGGHGGWGGCAGSQQAIQNLPAEKQEAVANAFETFEEKTEPMRDEMWALHTELEALSRAGASEQKISETVQKIRTLRADMRAERQALGDKLAEIGVPGGPRGGSGGCPGFGGHGSYHNRGGCGGYGGGMGGPGNCPGSRY